jgi:UDP-4-amino-4,6-dideoxy-N-acetyl-beta-L-altrosamine transaminase
MMTIPYARQDIDEDDIAAVVEVLRGDWITQGPNIARFERAVGERVGAAFAVAMNSATSALHVACLALDVGPGSLVWTVPNTFVASANCALYCGADVDFVDIDADTLCIGIAALRDKLADARARGGRLPQVLIPVHFGGQSCDMAALAGLAAEYGFRIIEDASHAIGGAYRGEPVGNCRYSAISIFSFHPAKIVTAGEGGMALTQDAVLARRMERLRSHGITREAADMNEAPDGPWYYQQIELGYNYRLTDIHAALGASQLRRLDAFVARRNALAAAYDRAFAKLPVGLQTVPGDVVSARHLYVIRVAAERHVEIFDALRARGVGVNLHYIPVHLQPWYRRLGFAEGQFPQSEHYFREAITLPLYASLDDAAQQRVIAAVRESVQ